MTVFSSLSRPELLEQLALLGNQSSNAIVQYHQAAAEKFGLNATDMKTLPMLSQTPMSAGEIAQSLGLTTGAITSVIDRLEKLGFVRRINDANDRRKVLVELVPEKLDESQAVYGPMADAIEALNQTLSDAQLALIAEYIQATTKIMVDEGRKLRLANNHHAR